MALAAMHRASWMVKAIYAIKLWMFCSQIPLTKKEEKGLREAAIFVVHVYLKAWFTSALPTSAPKNELNFLKISDMYKTINPSVPL